MLEFVFLLSIAHCIQSCYHKLMENEELTNRQKIENLLVDIYKNHKNHQRIERKTEKDVLHKFEGTIGKQVTFNGEFYDKGDAENSSVKIGLRYKNQPLAQIETEHGFINPGSMPFWTEQWGFVLRPDSPKGIADTTNIKVISPKWKEECSVCDVTYNTDQQCRLAVLHAPDETADAVVAKIWNRVVRSKDLVEVTEKLKRLNLPSNVTIKNVDLLAENLVNQIYEQDNKSRENMNAKNDGEMQW